MQERPPTCTTSRSRDGHLVLSWSAHPRPRFDAITRSFASTLGSHAILEGKQWRVVPAGLPTLKGWLQRTFARYTQPRVTPAVGKAAQTPSATVDLEAMRQADAMTLMDMITTLDEEVQEDLYNYMDEMRGPITPLEAIEAALEWAESDDDLAAVDPDGVVRLGAASNLLRNLHLRVCSRTPTIPVTAREG